MKYYLVSFVYKKGFGRLLTSNSVELNISEAENSLMRLVDDSSIILSINEITETQHRDFYVNRRKVKPNGTVVIRHCNIETTK